MLYAYSFKAVEPSPRTLINTLTGIKANQEQTDHSEAYADLTRLALLLADQFDAVEPLYVSVHLLLHLAGPKDGKHLALAVQAAFVRFYI